MATKKTGFMVDDHHATGHGCHLEMICLAAVESLCSFGCHTLFFVNLAF